MRLLWCWVVLEVEDDFAMRLQLLGAVVTVASVLLEELEAMLEIVDPQPPGKQRSSRMNTLVDVRSFVDMDHVSCQ